MEIFKLNWTFYQTAYFEIIYKVIVFPVVAHPNIFPYQALVYKYFVGSLSEQAVNTLKLRIFTTPSSIPILSTSLSVLGTLREKPLDGAKRGHSGYVYYCNNVITSIRKNLYEAMFWFSVFLFSYLFWTDKPRTIVITLHNLFFSLANIGCCIPQ